MTMPVEVPSDVVDYVGDISTTLAALRPDLTGVYLHGSAVLGGFRPARSDVDVLAVVAKRGTAPVQQAMGDAIAATAERCPGAGLEMSVITVETAARLGTCPFEVHVNTTAEEPVIVTGAGDQGDPDLVLHCAVCRDHAVAVTGPPPDEVFGAVARDDVLAAMVSDLKWALNHAPTAYAVLNACRASRFAADGQLCSKLDGARWWLARHPEDPVVTAAETFQRHGSGQAPTAGEAARFVAQALSAAAEAFRS
jgi:streptomycin 3"-adenylyltransferase